jgi:hypothetical protein
VLDASQDAEAIADLVWQRVASLVRC